MSRRGVALFEKDWGCGLVGGQVSWRLAFEVSKTHAKPNSFCLLPPDQDIVLTYTQHRARLRATMLPAIFTTEKPLNLLASPQCKRFLS